MAEESENTASNHIADLPKKGTFLNPYDGFHDMSYLT